MNIWREIQKKNFSKLEKLIEFLEIDEAKKSKLLSKSAFALNLPLRLASKIKKNSLNDPILRQFVPLVDENRENSKFIKDPVQDSSFCISNKLLKKYKSRALILCSSACAMHCRYCFRQNFPYETAVSGFEKEIEIIKRDKTISEVILSGGDPLSLSNSQLQKLLESLNAINHVKRIRFHTRFVIGIPERVDDFLIDLFQKIDKQIFFVIHVNHPDELDDDVFFHLEKIQQLKIPILTQTVLLKGINDSLDVLKRLCEELVNKGVIPYYLHDLDPVKGASHFKVPNKKGIELVKTLREEVSGYAVFRYVSEIPYKKSKTLIV